MSGELSAMVDIIWFFVSFDKYLFSNYFVHFVFEYSHEFDSLSLHSKDMDMDMFCNYFKCNENAVRELLVHRIAHNPK